MKLLLREPVDGLGTIGDVVTVSNGYGRNYLLPRQIGVPVTKENQERIEAEGKARIAREAEKQAELSEFAKKLDVLDITLRERVSSGDQLYGSVQAKQIAEALKEEGVPIDPDLILIEEPIKTIGVHRVKVKFDKDVTAELKIWVVESKDSENPSS
jgi:large subunit ribosomal protein L9